MTLSTRIIALAESFDGLYMTELIYRQALWRNVEHVEGGSLNYVPPVEFEDHYYETNEPETLAVRLLEPRIGLGF
jgi:hypothetical protein